jgi:ribonuclease E
MELSRQRLRPALAEGSHITCPRCNGTGVIRDIESSALHILRVIQEEAMKESTAAVYAQVPVDVATYLLNEKRSELNKLEARLKVEIVLIPNKHLETPHYKAERLRHDDERLSGYRASHTLADTPDEDNSYLESKLEPPKPRPEAVVKGITPDQPPPPVTPPAAPASTAARTAVMTTAPDGDDGLLGRILNWFRRKPANEASAAPTAAAVPAEPAGDAARRGRGSREGRERNGGRDGRERRGGSESREGRGSREARGDGEARGPRDRRERSPERREPREGRERRPERDAQVRAGTPDEATRDRAERAERSERPERGERRGGRDRQRTEARTEQGREATERDAMTAASAAAGAEAAESLTQFASRPVPAETTGTQALDGEVAQAPGVEADGEATAGDEARRGRGRRRRGGRRGDRGERTERGETGEQTEIAAAGATLAAGEETITAAGEMAAATRETIVAGGETVTAAGEALAAVEETATAGETAAVAAEAAAAGEPGETPAAGRPAGDLVVAETGREMIPTAAIQTALPFPAPVAAPPMAAPAIEVPPAPQPQAAESPAAALAPQPVEPIAPVELPKAQLEEILAGAGLQWVETVARPAAELPVEVPPPRTPRVRRPRATPVAEPLEQVETRPGVES